MAAQNLNVFIPGRGRSEDGMELTDSGTRRVETAAAFFHEYEPAGHDILVINSGYRSPGQKATALVAIPELDGEERLGVPEAVLGDRRLAQLGVPKSHRTIEPNSIDSATNLAYGRRLLHKGPVVFVAQQNHLDRFLNSIAPRVLDPKRHPYFGLVVPEIDPDNPEPDSVFSDLFSRAVLMGINPNTPQLEKKVAFRARLGWTAVKPLLRISRKTYTISDPTAETA